MRFKGVLCLIIVLCLLSPCQTVFAADADKTIRVGCTPYPGLWDSSDGVYSGYTYDYLMELSKYTGWSYEFVEADFADCTQMLADGELDLAGMLFYSEKRAQVLDFPSLEYGYAYATLFTTQSSTVQPYDYPAFDGMRVGVISDTVNDDYLRDYAAEHGFSCTTVEYSSSEKLTAAVLSQEVDAGIFGLYTASADTRILAQFATQPFYFATTAGNRAVLDELNTAQEQLRVDNPELEAALYSKHFGQVGIALTDAQFKLVEASQNNPITVGVVETGAPICYWDEETGSYAGITIELMNAISSKTGLQFSYSPVDIINGVPVMPDQEQPQLIAGVVSSDPAHNNRDLLLSDPLLNGSLAIVCRRGNDFTADPSSKTIAVVADFVLANEYAALHFPQHKMVQYDTPEQCIDAVASGDADATLYIQSCVSYLLQIPRYETLEIITTHSQDLTICAACLSEADSAYLSIINKGLSMITESERRRMTLIYTILNPYQMTFGDMLFKFRTPLAIIAILVIVLIAALSLLAGIKRNSERALRAALVKAEQASQAKGMFMSRMSHEIRTPLNAVIGFNTIARHELSLAHTEPEFRQAGMKVLDCITKSEIASKHLLTVINDVLDMSAIESGNIRVAHERFDFKNLISALTVLFFAQSKAKGIDFEVVFDSLTEEWFIGDQLRTNQIITNLLSNAVKFTPEGGNVRLTICQPEADVNAAHIHFEVSDNGIGMDKDYLDKIWAPFEQADYSISRRFGGTGLGLSITKNLVELMGGAIDVKSELGVGTTFLVDLTFERTEQPDYDKVYDFTNVNALVVDDDISTCEYINLLFDRCGARCTTASSGAMALDAVRDAKKKNDFFSLCIVDWRMPGMDGIETVKCIRDIAGKDIPIIIVTAYDFTEIEAAARQAGANLFIAKPLFQSSVFDLLATICGKSGSIVETKATRPSLGSLRVLLAEDNEMNMEIAQKVLSNENISVDRAWNGKEAVAMFVSSAADTYQVILMDIHMPEMDGYHATKEIRLSSHPQAKTIPIIAMTADAFSENVAEAIAAGMDDHVAKPIDPAILFDKLQKHTQKPAAVQKTDTLPS